MARPGAARRVASATRGLGRDGLGVEADVRYELEEEGVDGLRSREFWLVDGETTRAYEFISCDEYVAYAAEACASARLDANVSAFEITDCCAALRAARARGCACAGLGSGRFEALNEDLPSIARRACGMASLATSPKTSDDDASATCRATLTLAEVLAPASAPADARARRGRRRRAFVRGGVLRRAKRHTRVARVDRRARDAHRRRRPGRASQGQRRGFRADRVACRVGDRRARCGRAWRGGPRRARRRGRARRDVPRPRRRRDRRRRRVGRA